MAEQFKFDVFLSHSFKDKAVVRPIAQRLRSDGLKVWFDEWMLKPGEDHAARLEHGLQHSRVLILCMSANAFSGDWPQLERQTLRFRDPSQRERRFVLVRLDSAPLKTPLLHYLYIDSRSINFWQDEYPRLLEACRQATGTGVEGSPTNAKDLSRSQVRQLDGDFDMGTEIRVCAFSPDGKLILTGDDGSTIHLWDIDTGRRLKRLTGHTSRLRKALWSNDQRRILTASDDKTARLWDLKTGHCLHVFEGHSSEVMDIAWSPDEKFALTGGANQAACVWDVASGECLVKLEANSSIWGVAWNSTQTRALFACGNDTLQFWDLVKKRCLKILEGHTSYVWKVDWSADERYAVTSSYDSTVRFWDIERQRCVHVWEQSATAWALKLSPNDKYLCTSATNTVRVWDCETGRCLRVLTSDKNATIFGVAWSADGNTIFSANRTGQIRVWDVSDLAISATNAAGFNLSDPSQLQYTNAKVLLVGESGAGKTGLSKVLAGEGWQPSDSTVGAWATQWKLPVASDKGVEREIWLWDFGGQADQRLIHQLYMDETALAVLVFDGQKEDLFETLGQWDRDLTRASRKEFAKLLVAGRVDAGGVRVSRIELEKFVNERKFHCFLETSAKTNLGCDELKNAIVKGINWEEIPCRTTEILFKQLKEEIIRLKDEGRVLMRFNELRETLQLRLATDYKRFTDEELRAVITLLAGPGVVWELAFGSWILLQPERINAYAQAVIRTLQSDEHQRGCLMEERVLKGDLDYESSMPRLSGDEERFVLLAMHQILVERGLCLRQPTDKGNLLVFPSFYRRERPEQVTSPAVHVNYRFTGFLDDVYATLVVRLHHSDAFDQDQLWRYAADFKTKTGKQLGIKLNRRAPGLGELEVYFDPSVAMEEKIIFSKYVHEHLLQNARDVERLRHYVCQQCGTPVGNREVAMQRLNDWLQVRPPQPAKPLKFLKRKEETPSIICVGCEQRVPLWDDMEQCFASAEIQRRVRDMQEESAIILSNQSKERALVGEVISTVALANQISREFNVSDQGIDMEIEFTDDNYEATGVRIYLQLKSGDSYLHQLKKDGTEIFRIKDERHAHYWMAQPCPVLLVIRNSQGEVRWMEVRDWLKRKSNNGEKTVKQILFEGERFDVMSVRRWRDRCLNA
jgi:small GTP-binding protein